VATGTVTVADPLGKEPVEEIYHFWKLAGGDIETELASELKTRPPILRIPRVVPIVRTAGSDTSSTNTAASNGATTDGVTVVVTSPEGKRTRRGALELLYKDEIMPIFLHSLRARLQTKNSVGGTHYHFTHGPQGKHSLTSVRLEVPPGANGGEVGSVVQQMEDWKRGKGKYVPLEVREKDIDYQRHRVKVFRDLLQRLLDTEGKVAPGTNSSMLERFVRCVACMR
jgi:hypothetical protein